MKISKRASSTPWMDVNPEDFPAPPMELLKGWRPWQTEDSKVIETYYAFLKDKFPEKAKELDKGYWFGQVMKILDHFALGYGSKLRKPVEDIEIRPAKQIHYEDIPKGKHKWVDYYLPEEIKKEPEINMKSLNFEIAQKLIVLANTLDKKGLHEEADEIDELVDTLMSNPGFKTKHPKAYEAFKEEIPDTELADDKPITPPDSRLFPKPNIPAMPTKTPYQQKTKVEIGKPTGINVEIEKPIIGK